MEKRGTDVHWCNRRKCEIRISISDQKSVAVANGNSVSKRSDLGWQMEKEVQDRGHFTKCWVSCNTRECSCSKNRKSAPNTGADNGRGLSFQPWFYLYWPHARKPSPLGLQVLFRNKGYWSCTPYSRCSTALIPWPAVSATSGGLEKCRTLVPIQIHQIRICTSHDIPVICLHTEASKSLPALSFSNSYYKWPEPCSFTEHPMHGILKNLLFMAEKAWRCLLFINLLSLYQRGLVNSLCWPSTPLTTKLNNTAIQTCV